MTITYREFIHSLLLGARMLDETCPQIKTEDIIWRMWSFDDAGVHYIEPEERDKQKWNAWRPYIDAGVRQ
jgi:hypothetical protein